MVYAIFASVLAISTHGKIVGAVPLPCAPAEMTVNFGRVLIAGKDASSRSSPATSARGGKDYATYCSPCHGKSGNGDGPLAALLDPKPVRHNNAEYMNALSDQYLFSLIKDGGPAVGKSSLMASWRGILSEQQIRDLVAYLRSLAN